MKQYNGGMEQRSLLLDDPDSKTKSDVLSVLYALREARAHRCGHPFAA